MYFVENSHIRYQMSINSMKLATVRLKNAEGVASENSQRHSLVHEIALALILRSYGQWATEIFIKFDRRLQKLFLLLKFGSTCFVLYDV